MVKCANAPSQDLPQLACAEQDRDPRGADEIIPRRADAAHWFPLAASAARPRDMNKADHAGLRARERKVKRLVADIIAGVDGQAAG